MQTTPEPFWPENVSNYDRCLVSTIVRAAVEDHLIVEICDVLNATKVSEGWFFLAFTDLEYFFCNLVFSVVAVNFNPNHIALFWLVEHSVGVEARLVIIRLFARLECETYLQLWEHLTCQLL